MDRRRFIRLAGVGAGALAIVPLLEACSQAPAPPAAPATSAPQPTTAAATSGAAPSTGAAAPTAAAKPAAATPAAAQQAQAPAAGPARRGGQLNVVIQNDWVTLDPLFNSAEPNGSNMLYGEWIHWDKDDKGQWGPRPEMVAEWDLKPDVATFKLQQGVTFHDGTPWDAKAAKWNLDRLIFEPTSRMKAYWSGVDVAAEDQTALQAMQAAVASTFDYSSKAVEAIGDDTVKIHFSAPMAPILAVLSNAQMYPAPISPEAYKKQGKDAYGRNPVGAGPYRFVEWQSGSHVMLERNPNYWKKAPDGQSLPYIDKIQYRLVIDDSARLLELRSGNVHFMELVQGKDVSTVQNDPNLVYLESATSANQYRMIFDSTNDASPFKQQVKLRQALLYSLDREAMAKTLGFNHGYGRKYLLPKGSFAYDDSEQLPYYWYDKEKAQQLFKEAVAADPSIAGPDGKVPVTLLVIERAVDKAQGEMVKQMAEQVGFSVTLEILERAAMNARIQRIPGQKPGDYMFTTVRNPVTPDDPDLQWRGNFHTKSYYTAHLSDERFDKLIDAAATTYDVEQRKKLYQDLSKLDYETPWYGYLWQQNWNWTFNKKLQNFQEPLTNRWMFTECWLSP